MGIEVASSFTRKATIPLDDASVVADLIARDAIAAGIRYEGMLVYVAAEGTNFQLVGGITNGDWQELSGSGGEGGINYIVNGNYEDSDISNVVTYSEAGTLVSFTDSGDLVGEVGHTHFNGEKISFLSITSTTGISINTAYYVINAAANQYQISATLGGSAIALTTDGSGLVTSSVPRYGIGGTAALTATHATSSPLRGEGSLLLTKPTATNCMGQGWAWDFNIDPADKAKVLTIEVDYILNSGTFAAGSSNLNPSDVVIWIKDVTNSVMIQPSTIFLGSNSSNVSSKFNSTFQSAHNSVSYRLIIHQAAVTSAAYELKIDGLRVSPSNYVYGTPITDWVDFPYLTAGGTAASPGNNIITAVTTAPTYGTVVTNKAQWRRVGSNMEIRWDFRQSTSGSAGSGIYLFQIPPGYSIDLTKVTANNATTLAGSSADSSVGTFEGYYSTGSFVAPVMVYSSTLLKTTQSRISSASAGNDLWGSAATPSFGNSPLQFTYRVSVPILGWSSSVQMSDNASTRVVAARYFISSAASTTGGNPYNFNAIDYDTHGAVSTGTTTWRFTAPVSGHYKVTSQMYSATASQIYLFKNGASAQLASSMVNGNTASLGNNSIFLQAGDYINIVPSTTNTPAAVPGGAISTTAWITIERISGPNAIAASELVTARYYVGTGASTTSSNPINFDTKDFDTHGSVTTGAGVWKFTAPIAGIYQVNPGTYAGATTHGIFLYKNGVLYSQLGNATASTTSSGRSDQVYLNSGDYIQIFPSVTITPAAASPATVGQMNFINVTRLGGR